MQYPGPETKMTEQGLSRHLLVTGGVSHTAWARGLLLWGPTALFAAREVYKEGISGHPI